MIAGLDHVVIVVRPVGLDAANMQVGSEDLCFEWDGPIEGAIERLRAHGVPIEVGPVKHFGARARELRNARLTAVPRL